MIIRTAIGTVGMLFTGWLAIILAVTVLSDAAPASVVLFPNETLLRKLSEDTAIVSITPLSVTLASNQTGFALSLYQKGAWLVLPAGLRGCS
ncbi:MAG: hypothetical protein AAGK37_07525 [Pseudomonadota bacterium]